MCDPRVIKTIRALSLQQCECVKRCITVDS